MKTANIMKAVCVAGLAATCVWGLAGCAANNAAASSGAVAATVNGENIYEDDVTAAIENFRTQMSYTEEDAWGQWLADSSMTPESVREQIINSLVQEQLLKQGAKEKSITVDSAEIDAVVAPMKENYDSDEKWQQALTSAGFESEEEYRSRVEDSLMQNKLMETFATDQEPTDEELLEVAKMYAPGYDGAKRSSHILFESGDEATAQSVLDQINSGSLDFAEAAKQYSKDNAGGEGGSAAKGGDVGWDRLSSFVTEYTDALNGLEKDQVSGLVTSQYGIHIIKCTDVFQAPKAAGEDGTETVQVTSLDQIPAEFLDTIKQAWAEQKKSEASQAWFTECQESADIQINPMPEGLPYAVDMSKYQAATAEGDDAAAGSTDGAAPAEGAEGEAAGSEGGSEQPVEGGSAEQPAEAA